MKQNKVILLLVLFFLLSLFWEVSHSVLYDWNESPLKNEINFYVSKILYSSLGDLFFLIIMYLIIFAINKKFSWIDSPKKKDYFLICFFGIVISVIIEIKAKWLNQWNYTSYMPTIFGIGLTPLIQLSATFLISLIILNGMKEK